jgi:hypothetical protein
VSNLPVFWQKFILKGISFTLLMNNIGLLYLAVSTNSIFAWTLWGILFIPQIALGVFFYWLSTVE